MFIVNYFLPPKKQVFSSPITAKDISDPLLATDTKEISLTNSSEMNLIGIEKATTKDDYEEIMQRANHIATQVLSFKKDFESTKSSYSYYDNLSRGSLEGQEQYLPLLSNLQRIISNVAKINKEIMSLKVDFSAYDIQHHLSDSSKNKKARDFQRVIRKIDNDLKFSHQIQKLQSSLTRKIIYREQSSTCCIIS